IIDLHQNAGIHDRAIFLRHLRRERMEIVFVGLVIFVDADTGWDGRRQKYMLVGNPAAAAAALTLSISICTSLSPRYLTGPTQTTGPSETIAPPIIACLKYCSYYSGKAATSCSNSLIFTFGRDSNPSRRSRI